MRTGGTIYESNPCHKPNRGQLNAKSSPPTVQKPTEKTADVLPSAMPAALPVDESRPLPAMSLSIGLHAVLLVCLFWFASAAPKGTGETRDRSVGIAVVHRLPDRDQYQPVTPQPAQQTDSQSQSDAMAAAASAPPADLSPPIDLDGILSAMQSTPAPVSGSGIAGDQTLDGDAFGDASGTSASMRLAAIAMPRWRRSCLRNGSPSLCLVSSISS